jgi:hypothetical protein
MTPFPVRAAAAIAFGIVATVRVMRHRRIPVIQTSRRGAVGLRRLTGGP